MKLLIIGQEDEGSRLDKYLRRYLPKAQNSFLYKMLRKKNITRNGKKADGSEHLAKGDEIRLFLSDETIASFRSDAAQHLSERPVHVLYEDGDFLAVSKDQGVLTQRDQSGLPSLTDDVTGYLLRSGAVSRESLLHFRPSPVNRLDRNTSGIILFGKTLQGQQKGADLFRMRRVEKHYAAIVRGTFREHLSDQAYLIKDPESNMSRILPHREEGAEEIRTDFTPLSKSGDATLLDIVLHTGKPHQIRARLHALGYPIIGDPKYGDPDVNRFFRKQYGLRAQLLHAVCVLFPEDEEVPCSLRGKIIEAPFPPLFEHIRKDLKL